MSNSVDNSRKTAEFLLQIKAVKLNKKDPFTWASGWKSPIYCDNRKTLSYPKIRNYIRQEFVKLIEAEYGDVDVIAGVATGAIAIGALVAQELGKPFVYIRSSSKGHGLQNKIEGVIDRGQSVVVVEDLISTGGSSLKAVEALRSVGADVKGLTAIFTYEFDVSENAFAQAKCEKHVLTNYTRLIEQALEMNYIDEVDVASLKEWRENPSEWGK
jgi:orotate phosphoribosyltransferase